MIALSPTPVRGGRNLISGNGRWNGLIRGDEIKIPFPIRNLMDSDFLLT